jgi:hypothetical protein
MGTRWQPGEEALTAAPRCNEQGRAAAQQDACGEVSSLLGVSLGSAALLLRAR